MPHEKIKKIPVEEFTSPSPVFVDLKTPIQDIVALMREHGIRHLPVLEGESAVGIISDRDVKLAESFKGAREFFAEDIMTAEPYTVGLNTSLDEVAFQMSKNKLGSAIVLEPDGKVYGIFTSTDALNALIEVLRGEV